MLTRENRCTWLRALPLEADGLNLNPGADSTGCYLCRYLMSGLQCPYPSNIGNVPIPQDCDEN